METQAEKIRRFSEITHILLSILLVVFIAVGAIQALGCFWSVLRLPTEAVTVGDKSVEVPYLFKLGDFRVFLPVFIFGDPGINLQSLQNTLSTFVFGDVLRTVFILVVLVHAKRIFRILRHSGSPFREDVIAGFKKLAIALLCVGVVTGVVGFLAAGIVWVLCLIFDYGRLLQNESDSTL